jgi:hypothetical protein
MKVKRRLNRENLNMRLIEVEFIVEVSRANRTEEVFRF